MTIVLDGAGLTLERLMRIARNREQVELQPQALERIRACRRMLEAKIQAHEIMYGVNTGIGEFSEIVLNDEQVREFQRYLIYNHAAGPPRGTVEPPLSDLLVERGAEGRKAPGRPLKQGLEEAAPVGFGRHSEDTADLVQRQAGQALLRGWGAVHGAASKERRSPPLYGHMPG